MGSLTRQRYFAAAPDSELGEKLWARFEVSQREHTPRAARWCAAFLHYVGDETEAGRTWGMVRRGDVGELAAIRINRARRGSKARQALIASGDVKWKARAATNSAEAATATLVSEAWLEHDFEAAGIKEAWKQWGELSEVFGDGYAFTEWDWTRGSQVMTPNGFAWDGDVRTTIVPPWLVGTDNSVSSAKDRNWHFLVTTRPKIDLVHLYRRIRRGQFFAEGDEAERIIYDADAHLAMSSRQLGWYGQYGVDRSEEDNADVINFVHMPTLSMPLGLFVRMLGPDCILECRPLIGKFGDYDDGIASDHSQGPIQRLSADEIPGTPHAWAPFYNVIATQELLDGIDTVAATTVTSMGHPVYAIEKNSDNSPTKLSSGPEVWKMGPGGKAPALIERPQVSESLLAYREALGEEMQQDFSINEDATGGTASKEKNAQAEALRASMALQQVGPQAAAWRAALMRLGTVRLKTLRKNIRGERLLKLVGESKRHLLEGTKFFTAKTLEPLDTVELEPGNPMENTPEGRQALLEFYQTAGLLRTQESIDAVLATGRTEPVTDPVRDENLLIQTENEMILKGQAPMVYPTQNDVLHMRLHICTTMSVSALQNDAVLKTHDAHEREHWMQRFGCERDGDPLYRPRMEFIMGRGPEPMAPIPPPGVMSQTPPPQPGAPAQTPPPQPGGQNQTPVPTKADVQPTEGKSVDMPKNPLTGAAFQPNAPPVGALQ